MFWSFLTSMKGLECNNSTGWVDLLIIWCFNFSWTTSSTWMCLADNLQVYLMPVFSTPSYLFDNQSSQEPPNGNMEVALNILLVKLHFCKTLWALWTIWPHSGFFSSFLWNFRIHSAERIPCSFLSFLNTLIQGIVHVFKIMSFSLSHSLARSFL